MVHHGAICESLGYSNMLNEDHEDLEHLTVPRGSGFQAILLHEDDLQNNGPGPPEASTILTKKYKKQTDKWTPYVANNYKHLQPSSRHTLSSDANNCSFAMLWSIGVCIYQIYQLVSLFLSFYRSSYLVPALPWTNKQKVSSHICTYIYIYMQLIMYRTVQSISIITFVWLFIIQLMPVPVFFPKLAPDPALREDVPFSFWLLCPASGVKVD